jgi:hypothetical protein
MHTTVVSALDGTHATLRSFAAPPLKAAADGAGPRPGDGGPAGGDGGDNSSGGGGPSDGKAGRRCRPRCIWGDAVCGALLGEYYSGAEDCDEDPKYDSLTPELRGDEQAPVPFVRKRVSV